MEKTAIGTLLDSLDQNNRFKSSAYYTVCFGILPSSVRLALSIERTKELVDNVLKQIDLERFSFVPIFKSWVTEDFQTAQQTDDYAYEYMFKSETGQMIVHFIARDAYLTIDFLYDSNLPEAEQWILETNHMLRATFGTPKKPKFKVLMHQDGMFGTEDVNTGDFTAVDVNELYNDDFAEIDSIITGSLNKKESGIILLHGEPGTGKTTYIKHLICKFNEKEFIFIQNDFVRDLLKPTFVSFLLQNKNAILIIEDAEKVVASRDSASEGSVVSTILQLTDGLFSDFLNIKIICTFNTDIDRIDKALLRKGRMIAKYNFTPLSPEKTAALARRLGYDNVTGSLTLADIFEFDKHEFKNASKKSIGFVP
jgi:hypothetical protein